MFPYPHHIRVPPLLNNSPYFQPFLLGPAEFQSPLDLSLRTSIAITPPSTPSPPRKRSNHEDQEATVNPKVSTPSERFWKNRFGYFESKESSSPPASHIKWNKADETMNMPSDASAIANLNAPHSQYFDCKIIDSRTNSQTDAVESNSTDCINLLATEECDNNSDEDDFVDVLTQDESSDLFDTAKQMKCDYILLGDGLAESDDEVESNDTPRETNGTLDRDSVVYADEQLHAQAIEGFAKLFEKSLGGSSLKDDDVISLSSQCTDKATSSKSSRTLSNKMEKRKKIKKQYPKYDDEDITSPVSGTIIRKLREDEELVVRKGDIDPAFNVVEITDEAKAILASIDNKIGSYICQLCRALYDDAFQLAQHRCSRIVHIEYKCAECEKVFNCPANLASHRRWHKPRPNNQQKLASGASPTKPKINNSDEDAVKTDQSSEAGYTCKDCGKMFRRIAYLKKHAIVHQMTQTSIDSHFMDVPVPMGHFSNPMPLRNYPQIAGHFTAMFPDIDKRHLHKLREFYFQQSERMSAFQYVRNNEIHKFNKTNPFEDFASAQLSQTVHHNK